MVEVIVGCPFERCWYDNTVIVDSSCGKTRKGKGRSTGRHGSAVVKSA